MKSSYKIAAAVISSFVLGVGAASVLRAQAKPPAYAFAEINVKDQDGLALGCCVAAAPHLGEKNYQDGVVR